MNKKYDNNDYFNMLRDNIQNALSICELFDSGKFRTSTMFVSIIRTLVHDTKNSTSLLKRLDDKYKIEFLDTSIYFPPDTFHLQNFLFAAYIRLPGKDTYHRTVLPKFYFTEQDSKFVDFNGWWNNTILIIKGKSYSRKDIILITAHKHGVLHSDRSVDEIYYEFVNNIQSFAYFTETENIEDPSVEIEPLENSINSLIRQIAHELILSLINYYELDIENDNTSEEMKIHVAKSPIYDLSIAINPELQNEFKDIIRKRK